MRHALACACLWLAACDRASGQSCLTLADCGAGEVCLVDLDAHEGVCLDAPGRDVPPPPLRWFQPPARTDMLLVVDDGPGTAELQARSIASLAALVDEASDDDLRVAVTTANASSPICAAPNEASSGALAARSCLDRLDQFVGADGSDARWLCTDTCSYSTEELGLDPEQPWIDLHALPEGIDPVEALACLVPQGISGCEHAAPLWAALLGLGSSNGFRRHDEPVQVVLVTNGVDCPVTGEGAAAFDPDGLRALWSDPTAAEATAAVCWNAGVECHGDPAGFDDCVPVDRGLDGAPVLDGATPVLRSLGDLEDDLGWLADLHVIAGAPMGEPREPTYSAVGDPAWLLEHGIDPGCSDGTITALPPVRMRELATTLTSACNPDYAAPLRDALGTSATACVSDCIAEAVTVAFEPPGEAPVAIPACQGVYPELDVPAGAPACFAVREGSEACSAASSELVLRMRDPEVGAFLLEPNPWSPEVEIPGCED